MIDRDDLEADLSLPELVATLPPIKAGRPVHASTLCRWIKTGFKAKDGKRIRLAARRYPGGWKTTREALSTFLSRLTFAALGEPEPEADAPAATPSRRRQRELQRVDGELDRIMAPRSRAKKARAGRRLPTTRERR